MTVAELIEQLKDCDPNLEIIVSSDEEGNHFRHLGYVADDQNYNGDYNIQTGFRELTPELEEYGYSEADILDGKPCVVLY